MDKLEVLTQELASYQLNDLKRGEEVKKRIDGLELALAAEVKKSSELEARVSVLEGARQEQRKLNMTFAVKPEITVDLSKTANTASKGLWDFLKRK